MSEQPDVNLSEIARLAKESLRIRALISAVERQKSELEKQKWEVENKISNYLEAVSMKSIDMHGAKFTRTERWSVPHPQTLEDRKKFFDWLFSRDEGYELLQVHSGTLSSQYKKWVDEMEEAGEPVEIPGLGDPKISYTMSVKNKKSE